MSLNYFSILLSKIDLFGKAVELNFNGGGKSRTRIGGFFSILFFGFWIWSIYDVGQDIFKRKNPTTLATEVFTENPERMVLNPSTFSFAFGLEDPIFFSHYINESIYTMEVVVKQMRRQKNEDGSVDLIWKDIALETEVCTEAHFGDIAENFANLQLTQLYCLALDQPNLKEVSIEGMYESDVFDYIQISAKQCNPATSRVPCGSDEEIEALLGGGGYFAIYFTNRAVNTKNYKAPTHRYRDVSFTMFGNNYYKEIHMYLNHLEIRSDTGWLTTDESSQKYVQFGSIDETVALKQKEGSMLDFQIRTGKIVQVYNRSYIKIQGIAAQANGLSSVALIILLIFVTPFSNLKFYESLINELFDVRILKDDISKRKGGDNGKSQGPDQGMKMTRSKTMKKEPVKKKRKHKTSLELETRVDSKPVQIEVIDSPKSFLREDTNEYEQLKNGSLLNKTKVLYRTKEKKMITYNSPTESDLKIRETELKESPEFTHHASINFLRISCEDSTNQIETKNIPYLFAQKENSSSSSKQVSHGSPSHLFRDRPSPIKPNRKILEGFDYHDPKAIEAALESLVFDPDQGEKDDNVHRQITINTREKTMRRNVTTIENVLEKINESGDLDKENNISKGEDQYLSTITKKLNTEPEKLNITFWDYIRSFFKKNESMNEKMALINEGVRRINERLDIFQMFKKFREIDKLKMLLLEYDQLVLFEGLPRPELTIRIEDIHAAKDSKEFSRLQLRKAKFVIEQKQKELMSASYVNLKKKCQSTPIDQKLLDIYDGIME